MVQTCNIPIMISKHQSQLASFLQLKYHLTIENYGKQGVPIDTVVDPQTGAGLLDDMLSYSPTVALSFNETKLIEESFFGYDIIDNAVQDNVQIQWVLCELMYCPGDPWFDHENHPTSYFESMIQEFTLSHRHDFNEILYLENSTLLQPTGKLQQKLGTYLSYAIINLSLTSIDTSNCTQRIKIASSKVIENIGPADFVWGISPTSKHTSFGVLIASIAVATLLYVLSQMIQYRNHSVFKDQSHFGFSVLQLILCLVNISIPIGMVMFINGQCTLQIWNILSLYLMLVLLIIRLWRIYCNDEERRMRRDIPYIFRLLNTVNQNVCCGNPDSNRSTVSNSQYWKMVTLFSIITTSIVLTLWSGSTRGISIPLEDYNLQIQRCHTKNSTDTVALFMGILFLLCLLLYSIRLTWNAQDLDMIGFQMFLKYFVMFWVLLMVVIFLLYRSMFYHPELNILFTALLGTFQGVSLSLPMIVPKLNLIWHAEKIALAELKRATVIYDSFIKKLQSNTPVTAAEYVELKRTIRLMGRLTRNVRVNTD